MRLILVAGTTILVAQGAVAGVAREVRLPFRQEPFGVCYITTICPGFNNDQGIETVLTLNRSWEIGITPSDLLNVPPIRAVHITGGANGGESFSLRLEDDRDNLVVRNPYDPEILSRVGIGHDSSLLRDVGAVSVIRRGANGGELILGSSLEAFEAECMPGSVIRVPLRLFEGYDSALDLTMDLVETAVSAEGLVVEQRTVFIGPPSGTRPVRVRGPLVHGDGLKPPSLFSVSEFLAAEISSRLAASGARLRVVQRGSLLHGPIDEMPESFLNCTREMIEGLPHLYLIFFDGITGRSPGSILFTPEEYMKMMEDDVCETRYVVKHPANDFLINPLLFPRINFYMDNGFEIAFGDSRDS